MLISFEIATFVCRDGRKLRKSSLTVTNLQPDIRTGNFSNMTQIPNRLSTTFSLMELNSAFDFSEKRGNLNNRITLYFS
jgi:hypothetical protein